MDLRWSWIAVLLLRVAVPFGMAQSSMDDESAIARVAGVSDVSELDAQEYERFEALFRLPVPVNLWNEAKLEQTGLFSAYQIAAIADYRIRNGDLLSAMELAQVDGFSAERVAALRPFLDFAPRAPDKGMALSGEFVWQLKGKGSYGAPWDWQKQKYKGSLEYGPWLSGAYSPSGSRNLAVSGGRRLQWQLTLGDYRARFGQGLVLWNGFSTSGVTALGGFARIGASGVSPAHSWSEGTALRGLAGQLRFGRNRISVFAEGGYSRDRPLLLGCNLTRLLRNGQWGISGYRKAPRPAADGKAAQNGELKLAADFIWNWRGTELYGEVAWDALPGCVAGVGGVRFPIGDQLRFALTGRYYPARYQAEYAASLRAGSKVRDETGLALGGEWNPGPKLKAVVTADAALQGLSDSAKQKRQLKLHSQLSWQLHPAWRLELRAAQRIRSGAYNGADSLPRSELRADLQWGSGSWKCNTRIDGVHWKKNGLLGYLEQGFDNTKWRLYVRETLFWTDGWADRIYAYERDAPGGFSVPAFYGHGMKIGLLAGRKLRFFRKVRLSLYARSAIQIYPFPGYRKAAQTEGKVQAQLTF